MGPEYLSLTETEGVPRPSWLPPQDRAVKNQFPAIMMMANGCYAAYGALSGNFATAVSATGNAVRNAAWSKANTAIQKPDASPEDNRLSTIRITAAGAGLAGALNALSLAEGAVDAHGPLNVRTVAGLTATVAYTIMFAKAAHDLRRMEKFHDQPDGADSSMLNHAKNAFLKHAPPVLLGARSAGFVLAGSAAAAHDPSLAAVALIATGAFSAAAAGAELRKHSQNFHQTCINTANVIREKTIRLRSTWSNACEKFEGAVKKNLLPGDITPLGLTPYIS